VIPLPRFATSHAAIAVAALGAAAACRAEPLPAGVDDCLARIEQRIADTDDADAGAGDVSGPARLGDVCPELAAAIGEGAWGAALIDVSAEDLTGNAFGELARLVAGYERPAEQAGQPLSAESLDAVLAALNLREPDAQPGLWERLRKWLGEQFGAQDGPRGKWIEDWLGKMSLPERFVRYLLIALGTALVITTVAVVMNELRIAGVLAGGALRKYSPLAARGADDVPARDFGALARAPLARRPALLLLLVLDRLRERARLPLRDSLTHRELVAAAGSLSADQSDALRTVAGAAERATFGGWQPAEHEVDAVVARGRTLVASLGEERSEPQ
jgi:hypothetical protein